MRKIIHLDMDAFYASIEMRDNPSLRTKPIAVGGGYERGVVATCNYEARKYGVRSAMSGQTARRLCPRLIFLPLNMKLYKEEARKIKGIMHSITPLVESVSLDEAYLDVTDSSRFKNSATLIAEHLKEKIYQSTGLTASAGVAPNKFLAKIASDWNKPDGIKVIPPSEVENFVLGLAVGKIQGVGRVMEKKLHAHGIKTCADLRKYSEEQLFGYFGKFGLVLHMRSLGKDESRVIPYREPKSLSVETTFARDIEDDGHCRRELERLLIEFNSRRSKKLDSLAVKGIFIKIKFSDFMVTTKQAAGENLELAKLMDLYKEARLRSNKPVRLLGLGVYFSSKDSSAKGAIPKSKRSSSRDTQAGSPFKDSDNYSLFV